MSRTTTRSARRPAQHPGIIVVLVVRLAVFFAITALAGWLIACGQTAAAAAAAVALIAGAAAKASIRLTCGSALLQ